MKKTTENDNLFEENEMLEFDDSSIDDYDSYDECADILDDEDIEILETRKKNEDYGEKSVGIVSEDLWGDWNRDNLVKKERKNIENIRFVGCESIEDIVSDNELKELSKGIFKSQSSNYYNGVLNNELRKSNLYDKFRIIYIYGYYYGY